MKLSKKLQDALNEQVRMEYESAYIYNGMSLYLSEEGFPGASHWMDLQAKEEMEHAQDFIDFIHQVGGHVELGTINKQTTEYDSLLDVWQTGLEHEKVISKSIHDLLVLAIEEKHFAAENFLRTYVDEQVEEENNFCGIVGLLKFAGDNPLALMNADGILGRREG